MWIPVLLASIAMTSKAADTPNPVPIRPRCVPLVAVDPYFSIWSPSERLAEADTQHWTGGPERLFVSVTIDGKPFRLVGKSRGPKDALPQTKLEITPTITRAQFTGAGAQITLEFMTASIPSDLTLFSEPLTYLSWSAQSVDGRERQIAVSVEASAHIAASADDQAIRFEKTTLGDQVSLTMESVDQPVLEHRGDQTQIDWGTFFLSAPKSQLASAEFSQTTSPQAAGKLLAKLIFRPVRVSERAKSGLATLCYDDAFSIQYFKQNLRGFWRSKGQTGRKLVAKAGKRFAALRLRCAEFDHELMRDFISVGGLRYAELASLAFKQCVAGCKLVADPNGQPLWFPKENTSNGCIGTVDVIYPMSPQALLFGPTLTKALLAPVLEYASSPRWKFPFAPHDLGTWPQANGQVYGGGERTEDNQMPVEESANMLILLGALAKMEQNADFARPYWPTISKWADYLKAKGFDPENQLCTDDFLGHLAHNVNLSAKAILGLRSYASLAQALGHDAVSREYEAVAKSYAERWIAEATHGDHTSLTFDKPDSWSQKYNLVWDRLLGFDLFPETTLQKEMAWYRQKLNPFGLPLDSRSAGAKLDWSIWTATLTRNREDFDALFQGVYRYADESPQRVGLGDWYDTATGDFRFMHSRPIVGGALIPLLYDAKLWAKWSKRDAFRTGVWAPLPTPPTITTLVPAADKTPSEWKFTLETPKSADWMAPSFNDEAWKTGMSGFGSDETPGARNGTQWTTGDLWLRKRFDLPNPLPNNVCLWLHHDEDVEVYVNGVLAYRAGGYTTEYEVAPIAKPALKALKPGANTIAIHCHQTNGGQYVDCGFVVVDTPTK